MEDRIIIIAESGIAHLIEESLGVNERFKLYSRRYPLNKKTQEQFQRGFYHAALIKVTSDEGFGILSQLLEMNPFVPRIVLMPSNFWHTQTWRLLAASSFDVIVVPEHLENIERLLDHACSYYQAMLWNKNAKAEILEKLDQLSIIIEAGRTITSTLNLEEVVNSIMDMCTALIRAEAWSLLLIDEETNELVFRAARGSKGKKVRDFRLIIGQGIAGWVARERKPLIVNDVEHDDRFFKEIDLQTKFVTKAILCAPLVFKGKLLGVIEIINRLDNQPFEKKDLSMISILLDSAAIAIENALLYNRAEELAITDDLTLLFNARYLERVLETELSRSKRYDTEVSFIFMDLDHFKYVNDNFGHMVGREVLKEVAQLMRASFRETDIIARYGGDEFVLVLPETGTQETFELAERMRQKIEQHVFLAKLGYTIRLTASFGISTYPIHTQDRRELILMADKAMFQAKGHCRNLVYITSKEDVCETLE